MAEEEKKLGPNATFTAEGQGEYVQIFGLTFKKGEPVNVEELLGTAASKRVLEKLARHPQFEVDGQEEAVGKPGDPDRLSNMQAAAGPVIQEEQKARAEGREPPEGYDAPLAAVLENPAGKPRGQSAEHASERGQEQRRANTPKGRQ